MWENSELSRRSQELFEKGAVLEKVTRFVQRSTAKLGGPLCQGDGFWNYGES